MRAVFRRAAVAAALILSVLPVASHAQHAHAGDDHAMFSRELTAGWRLLGMAQLFPMATVGFGSNANDAVRSSGFYANQPVVMFNIESPASRIVLRTTLNFEGFTQRDGELTFGGWGEGFIDSRHPHTVLHEAVLSFNAGTVGGGAFSVSAGKGFAPYGTDDPMSRPAVKFPTNHHLSQILERFFASATWLRGGLSLEAGIFGGDEPTGPWDMSNINSFPNSWSGRVAYRFGGMTPAWEASASYGNVVEHHHDDEVTTRLANVALRHESQTGFGHVYGLIEASRSMPAAPGEEGYWSVLGETQLSRAGHRPYARLELAIRPEYRREGPAGTPDFFRYDHDSHAIGATRWAITTVGYGYDATSLPFSIRPFVELQHNNASAFRGGIAARELFGTGSFFSATAGARIFLGGGPMRMGAYGVLDAMTAHGAAAAGGGGHEHHHH